MPPRLGLGLLLALFLATVAWATPQGAGQDDKILQRGEQLLEDAKSAYEDARSKNSVAAFVEAGFKLEEARIKFIVLQEIGSPENQKLATDRLRAMNQLSKLIHDGKVAISGTPADSPIPVKPTDAPQPPTLKEPPSEAPSPPARPMVDVTKRAQVPDAAKQKEAENLLKDLFKDQYAKKGPADRQALARALLAQATQSKDDPVSMWVTCREAQDIAAQVCDINTLIAAIDQAAHFFDIDSLSLKSSALATASKSAKTPDDFSSLAIALDYLINELMAADQYDAADKAASSATQYARRANDAKLVAHVTARAKDVTEAKTRYQGIKSALQTLAKTPEDPPANLEMGQFLCFVKGSWDLGLRFLVKGSDAVLKSLSEKELGLGLNSTDLIAVADSWYDLSEKEKVPYRKNQLLAHSGMLYERALEDSVGLARARIEKRLDLIRNAVGAANERPGNLKKAKEPSTAGLVGRWYFDEGNGGTTSDSSGMGNNGKINGTVSWTKGISGNALSFEGGYVSFGISGMPHANAAKTIAWAHKVSSNPGNTNTIISLKDESSSIQTSADYRSGKITIAKWTGTPLIAVDPPAAGEWHFFAYTFDGKTHKLYVDGALKGSSTVPTPSGPFKVLEMGQWKDNDQTFHGMLDEVRIYTRALSESEIQGLVINKQ